MEAHDALTGHSQAVSVAPTVPIAVGLKLIVKLQVPGPTKLLVPAAQVPEVAPKDPLDGSMRKPPYLYPASMVRVTSLLTMVPSGTLPKSTLLGLGAKALMPLPCRETVRGRQV